MLLSFSLVTPLSIYSVVRPIKKSIEENEMPLLALVAEWTSPLIIALVNVVIIPFIIDLSAMLLSYETLSKTQNEIMITQAFFMVLNMVILPLTGLISFEELWVLIQATPSPSDILELIVGNTGNMASFFVTYLLQVTFLSNVVQMLDLPHFLWKKTSQLIFWMRELPYSDDWGFQMGYYQALMYTISFMSLLFSISLPMVSMLAALFFSLRYYIEKYNFLFVYTKEYESIGLMKMNAGMQIASILFFQLSNFALIGSLLRELKTNEPEDDKDFITNVGYVIVGVQLVVIATLKCSKNANSWFRKLLHKFCFLEIETSNNQKNKK